MQKKKDIQYRIIGAYDSETTNYNDHGVITAFPILHQLGILQDTHVIGVFPHNVENVCKVEMFRHTLDLYARLDELVSTDLGYVPVICCHNLPFDMYGLSQWLNRHDVRVLAKSARKPITFAIRDENGRTGLVIWDTLIFSQQSLERMGVDCGYSKGVGEWDYSLTRTPDTPLSRDELDYASRDIYTLLCWLGWWLRRNPDISPEKLALNVVTKTGVVRERRKVRFEHLKGKGNRYDLGRYWYYMNREEAPKSDDELYTMQAATRGGFTFCASKCASIPYDLGATGYRVYGFDSTSQHPAQMVSHNYPIRFKEKSPALLELKFEYIKLMTVQDVLDRWDRPFPNAFYACFEFENLRPKAGSIFEKFGILPLASARYRTVGQYAENEDNGDKTAHDENRNILGYCDYAENAECKFGKLVSASLARVYITELTAFEICQCYDFDSFRAIHGYATGRFVKPPDMAIVSVMQFYKAKNLFKHAREEYFSTGSISNGGDLVKVGIPETIVSAMETGSLSDSDVEATYLLLKADLN